MRTSDTCVLNRNNLVLDIQTDFGKRMRGHSYPNWQVSGHSNGVKLMQMGMVFLLTPDFIQKVFAATGSSTLKSVRVYSCAAGTLPILALSGSI
jgi:hypothetical protein